MKLKPFVNYQGSKRRIAYEVIDFILENDDGDRPIYDVCCGSGVIGMKLVERGVAPTRLTMIDAGLFGLVFQAIGNGSFDVDEYKALCDALPDDPALERDYLNDLYASYEHDRLLIYYFLLFQAATYRGTPIELVPKSPATFRKFIHHDDRQSFSYGHNYTIVPRPALIIDRMQTAARAMKGITGLRCKADAANYESGSIVYIDPPYQNTAGYLYDFNIYKFVATLPAGCDVYVSEAKPMSTVSWFIANLSGRDEYLSYFRT